MIKKLVLVLCWIVLSCSAFAESFKIKKINIEGLRRIDKGVVYNHMPLAVGDTFKSTQAPEIIKDLYSSGYFSSVEIETDKNTLIIKIKERPVISEINIDGNENIKTEDLRKVLTSINLKEGFAFNPFMLQQVEWELKRQYYAQGKYAARIDSKVEDLGDNRVELTINISEGKTSSLQQINFVGNKAFTQSDLLKQFSSSPASLWSLVTHTDYYEQQRVAGDLESLKSFYLDNGFLDFKIRSLQTEISPNKKYIYLTINLDEGHEYRLGDIKISGETIVPVQKLRGLVTVHTGDLFSNSKLTEIKNDIHHTLSSEGYSFAEVNVIKTVDNDKNIVNINFFIQPGNKIYVRNIKISGNTHTNDAVIRRQLIQLEASLVSNDKIEESKRRIYQLGYISNVEIKTVPVPGKINIVDLEVDIKEGATGKFSGGVSYSQLEGFGINISVSHDNVLGTGKSIALDLRKTKPLDNYYFYYNHPYITTNGGSFGFSGYYTKTKANELDISNYTVDRFGGQVMYGVPVSLYDRVNYGFEFQNLGLKLPAENKVSTQISDFTSRYGQNYVLYFLSAGWHHVTLNRSLFPTSGIDGSVSLRLATPIGSLQYYTTNGNLRYYTPLYKDFVLYLHGGVGYGTHYSDTKSFPFFENFFSGGTNTVRGFSPYSLGPKDSLGRPIGGNFSVNVSGEVIFPLPYFDSKVLRTSVFIDAGNVFQNRIKTDEIRVSVGVAALWLSPLNIPLQFSLATPIRKQASDDLQAFQFNMGVTY